MGKYGRSCAACIAENRITSITSFAVNIFHFLFCITKRKQRPLFSVKLLSTFGEACRIVWTCLLQYPNPVR